MQSYKVLVDTSVKCLSNIVESSRIYRYLIENGHEVTDDESEADFIIINSCGATKVNQDRYINLFHKYYSLKEKNARIIMFGCLVKIDEERLRPLDVCLISFEESYKLDTFFYSKTKFQTVRPYCSNDTKKRLIRRKERFLVKTNLRGDIKNLFLENITFLLSAVFFPLSKKVRVNYEKISAADDEKRILVEICRGCVGNCSYCVIKKARGNIRSRKIEDIISDIETLYNPSKNIMLVADDCSCYGLDINSTLIELIYEINKRFPKLSIDLNYINPRWLEKYPEKHIKLFKEVGIGAATVTMQSGSTKIVKSMDRNYNTSNVIKIVDQIKKVSPQTIMFSHFIIGHPQESTVDFLKTLSSTKHFDYSSPFIYSDLKGTRSASLPNKKSKFVKLLRFFIFILFTNFVMLHKLLTYPSPNR